MCDESKTVDLKPYTTDCEVFQTRIGMVFRLQIRVKEFRKVGFELRRRLGIKNMNITNRETQKEMRQNDVSESPV